MMVPNIGKGGRFLNMFRRNIKDMPEHAKNRGISLEQRLLLYWRIMVLAVMAAVFVVLTIAGVFSNDAGKLGGTLSVQQKNTTMTFNQYAQCTESCVFRADYVCNSGCPGSREMQL